MRMHACKLSPHASLPISSRTSAEQSLRSAAEIKVLLAAKSMRDALTLPASASPHSRHYTLVDCSMSRLSVRPAGPISTLLQHLRDQVSEGGSSTASTSSRHTSRNTSLAGSEAATSAAAAAVAAAVAAQGTGRQGTGGGELNLGGKGLTDIPTEVWQVRAHAFVNQTLLLLLFSAL